MVNINGPEFLVIALLAMLLVGPERLPEYVRGLRAVVVKFRSIIKEGQSTLKEELGDDIDWNQLDPRNYDPRKIVREALFEDAAPDAPAATPLDPVPGVPSPLQAAAAGAGAPAGRNVSSAASATTRKGRRGSWSAATLAPAGGLAPFDDEAT